MVIRRTTYPQVVPRADGLMTKAVVTAPRGATIAEAALLGRRQPARLPPRLVVARCAAGWGGATPAVLERALALGLGKVPLAAVLWPLPVLAAGADEVTVRRTLGPRVPAVGVRRRGRLAGVVLRDVGGSRALPRSATAELARLDAATAARLREVAAIATELGWPLAVVGGFVRDLLLGRSGAAARDLDLVVEGDGRALARRLGRLAGGRVREHEAFLTATVTLPDGRAVDVATARRERYAAPGALPRVEPASLAEDLARRDFSVNALAIRLDGEAWGKVLDSTGGLEDLAARRVRVLHPLSFVEDPTRIFRAVRFAARLDFQLDAPTRQLLTAAAGLGVYPSLSGDRLWAEVAAIAAEPEPAATLARLGRLGGLRLVLPTYRFGPTPQRLLARAGAWTGRLAPDDRLGLALLALGARLTASEEAAWLARWGAPAPVRRAIARARGEARPLARRLGSAAGAGEAYAALRGTADLSAAWAAVLAGDARTRRHVESHLGRWRRLPPLLTGDDLSALGLAPGPLFGRLLDELRGAQVAGRLRSREAALAWVRRAITKADGRSPEESENGQGPEPKGG